MDNNSRVIENLNPIDIIERYYQKGTKLYNILITHSQSVAALAMQILYYNPHIIANRALVYQAAMLHDIGIYQTHAPKIECHGTQPYITHSEIGYQILQAEGLPLHAQICLNHTGCGISKATIIANNLPISHQDHIPTTTEQRLVAYADKFFSKSNLTKVRTVTEVEQSVAKHGAESLQRFMQWQQEFKL